MKNNEKPESYFRKRIFESKTQMHFLEITKHSFWKRNIHFLLIALVTFGCKVEKLPTKIVNNSLPKNFGATKDSSTVATILWRKYFKDPKLTELIEEALKNNQELNIMQHEIEISRNEIMTRQGEYQPFGYVGGTLGVEKSGRYTWNGVSEEDLKTSPEKHPRFVGDQAALSTFSWELDPWKKLHNAKDAAVKRYMATIEGKNYLITNLIAEIARSYYELIVLDNELQIVQQNIALQQDALEMVKVQKEAARVNQLAINRFTAQLINTENLRFEIQQNIIETENRINLLAARYTQKIERNKSSLSSIQLLDIATGIPSDLLRNRPDIRKAEQDLEATKLDIAIAKANFLPNITLRAGLGLKAFNPLYLVNPKSLAFNLLGDIVGPLINKNSIKANYYNANEKQIQTVYQYEQIVLNAYLEVMNQLSASKNFGESYQTKANQVEILNSSIEISNSLFKTARADYTEVLLTQREALEAKMELTEIKRKKLSAEINLYKALGGGWQ